MSEQDSFAIVSDAFQGVGDIQVNSTYRTDGADALVRLHTEHVERKFKQICSNNGFTHDGGEPVRYPSQGHDEFYKDFWVAVEE